MARIGGLKVKVTIQVVLQESGGQLQGDHIGTHGQHLDLRFRQISSFQIASGVHFKQVQIQAHLGKIFFILRRSGCAKADGITEIVDGPISAEVISMEAEGMLKEAEELVKIHKNIVIKIPMCAEGLKAASKMAKKGIKTNVTLIFSAQQALLAARAGATYVSPFVGRLDDVGAHGVELLSEIAEIFALHNIETQIIAASIRTPKDIVLAAQAGCDIATVPFNTLMKSIEHPLTTQGIERFLKDWESVPKK